MSCVLQSSAVYLTALCEILLVARLLSAFFEITILLCIIIERRG